jgi:hypothetical protein
MLDAALDPPRTASRSLLLVAAGAGMLVAATAALWVNYGTAVFFEVIAAGLAACF